MAVIQQVSLDEFLGLELNPGGAPLDLKVELVPEGDYQAQITSLQPRIIESRDSGERRLLVEVMWSVMDPGVKEAMGIDNPRARQTLWIDTEPGWNGGSFSMKFGKNMNTNTGKLLEALGMNTGKPFRWPQLMHSVAYVRVTHPANADEANLANVSMVAGKPSDLPPRKR